MVEPEEVLDKSRYSQKSQLSEYRVYARKGEFVDPETGEITVRSTGRFTQKKRALRTGDAVRMCRINAGRTLDKLAFAGGEEGRALLAAIREEALRPYNKALQRKGRGRFAHFLISYRPPPGTPLSEK